MIHSDVSIKKKFNNENIFSKKLLWQESTIKLS
jgi:hypothetical protein